MHVAGGLEQDVVASLLTIKRSAAHVPLAERQPERGQTSRDEHSQRFGGFNLGERDIGDEVILAGGWEVNEELDAQLVFDRGGGLRDDFFRAARQLLGR